MTTFDAGIRAAVDAHAHLATAVDHLGDEDDLYQAGLSSHASVNLMLALEDSFDVEFPDAMLSRDTFRSIAAIRTALVSLQELAS